MTLEQLLSVPKGMNIVEYQKLLDKETKLCKQIRSVSDKILSEDDSLDVLSDEVGSNLYNKHLDLKVKYEKKRDRLVDQLDDVRRQLKGEQHES